jgi:hypothetical protein
MLSVSDALKLISEHTPKPKIQRVLVDMALGGSVLAEDVKAAESVPAFRASIVDGYAVSLCQYISDMSTTMSCCTNEKASSIRCHCCVSLGSHFSLLNSLLAVISMAVSLY